MFDRSQAAAGSAERGPGQGWQKASYSQSNGHCVEVARLTDGCIGVRDSKAVPGGHVLHFEPTAWTDFLRSLQNN
jgi:hypothetical protein